MTAETSVLPSPFHHPRSGALPEPGTYRAEPSRCILEFSTSLGPLTTLRGRFAVLESTLKIASDEGGSSLSVEAGAASLRTTRPLATRRVIGSRGLAVREHHAIRFASTGFEATDPDTLSVPGELFLRDVAIPLTLRARIVSRADDRLLIVGVARIAYRRLREACPFRLPRSVPAGHVSLLLAADFR